MEITRRAFVAAASVPVWGANERISIGMIGTGSRGRAHLNDLAELRAKHNATITAVCDVYRPNREHAAGYVKARFGDEPRQFTDYRELLAQAGVDAVVIAAPDFTHSPMLKAAVEAGKDVYCEKPMGTDFAEAKAAYLAVKKSPRVVQIGTQRRSEGKYVAAAKLVHSGALGQITRIDINANFQEPRWRRDYTQVKEADVAWDDFHMHRPRPPYDARRLREWQLFRDYTNGIPGLWMSHFSDCVVWFMQDPYPATAVANGGVFLWKDGRETQDVFQAVLTYPKSFVYSFAMSLTSEAGNRQLWIGTKGTLDTEIFIASGAGSRRPDKLEREIRLEAEPVSSHMENWLECLRSRQTPRCDVQAGFSHAVAGCMAAVSYETGRRVGFDAARLELV